MISQEAKLLLGKPIILPYSRLSSIYEYMSNASPAVIEILGSKAYWSHEFDLSESCDVIRYVTIGLDIGHFLWNYASVSNGFQDIQCRISRNG